MKQLDYLYHFTKDFSNLKAILHNGFKPSYAKERLADKDVLIPMVSFSNILLRDTGADEVINYGDYALCLNRDWGIANDVNPVIYTYDHGLLYNALKTFLHNTVILTALRSFKSHLKEFNQNKVVFSKSIKLTNTSKEVLDILDYLSMNYNERLIEILADHANTIHDANFPILTLTKPYKVNKDLKEFDAYNDREWRKVFSELMVLFEGGEEYQFWSNLPKPHFHDKKYSLLFSLEDIKAIIVQNEDEIQYILNELEALYDTAYIKNRIENELLVIGTKAQLLDII